MQIGTLYARSVGGRQVGRHLLYQLSYATVSLIKNTVNFVLEALSSRLSPTLTDQLAPVTPLMVYDLKERK